MNFKPSRNEQGATLLECAIALPIFLFALVATFELLRISYNALTLQFVVTQVMREASINSGTDIKSKIEEKLNPLGVSLAVGLDTVTYCPGDKYRTADCPEGSIIFGDETEIMIASVTKRINAVVLPGYLFEQYAIEARALGRNEPD